MAGAGVDAVNPIILTGMITGTLGRVGARLTSLVAPITNVSGSGHLLVSHAVSVATGSSLLTGIVGALGIVTAIVMIAPIVAGSLA